MNYKLLNLKVCGDERGKLIALEGNRSVPFEIKRVYKEYDIVCSLGGNCAAAHNLFYKNLRLYALPFDWKYCESDEAIYTLEQ